MHTTMADLLLATSLASAGISHGFSLRSGGVSDPPYDSLNLGRAVGDDPRRVAENNQRFARAVGFVPGALFEVSQVHGPRVRRIMAAEAPTLVRTEQADALVCDQPSVAIGVRVADCLAVLLADPTRGVVAAVHAGWRGASSNIAGQAVESLVRMGARPERLLAVLMPHIRPCCFEVGSEVADQLQAAAPGLEMVNRSRERPHVDLSALVQRQLTACGVSAVQDLPGCTRCESDRFFSYRRDGRRSGRHLAAIVCPPRR